MKFEVWCRCRDHCEGLEEDRKLYVTEDPVDAIRKALSFRDQTHETWVQIEREN